MRNKITRKVLENKPLVSIASPPCTDWSTTMNFDWDQTDPDIAEARRRIAREHLNVRVEFYNIQMDSGRNYPHDHPRYVSHGMEMLCACYVLPPA